MVLHCSTTKVLEGEQPKRKGHLCWQAAIPFLEFQQLLLIILDEFQQKIGFRDWPSKKAPWICKFVKTSLISDVTPIVPLTLLLPEDRQFAINSSASMLTPFCLYKRFKLYCVEFVLRLTFMVEQFKKWHICSPIAIPNEFNNFLSEEINF